MGNFIDLTGQRFGRLVVVSRAPNKSKHTMWNCVCDCGNETIVSADSLRRGATTSCGCYGKEQLLKANTKHGLSGSRIKRIYYDMHSRCENPNTPKFKNHGGRGIKVCNEWSGEDGLINFNKWALENGYSDDLSIDRIDNDGNYEPNNCRWATYNEQQLNRRNTILIETNGVEKQIKDIASETGLSVDTLWGRYYRGVPIEELEDKPSHSSSRNTSGVTGVRFRKDTKKWNAYIDKDNVHYSLGNFISKDDAIKARLEGELKYYGKYVNHVKESRIMHTMEG